MVKAAAWAWVACALLAGAIEAQSATTGSVAGTIRSPNGPAVSRALVTVTSIDEGPSREETTDVFGAFLLRFLPVGVYELRVEAIGFRPLVARTLAVNEGDLRHVTLTLRPEEPPVVGVDTVMLADGAAAVYRGAHARFGPEELDGLPLRSDDLASVLALSSDFDESLGTRGLPGSLSVVVADGVPFYRAPHPVLSTEFLPNPLFSRALIRSVRAHGQPRDVRHLAAPAGFIEVSTPSSAGERGLEIEGAYSGNPLWSSSELDIDTPSLLSFQGSARGSRPVGSGQSRLTFAGEALRHQTPLVPRVGEGVAAGLAGLDADLLAALTEPTVESYGRYGGLARLDVGYGRTGSLFVRGMGSYTKRELDGLGPAYTTREAAPAETSKDLSLAAGLVGQYSNTLTLELRTAVSGSFRDFESGSSAPGPAYLTGLAAPLGDLPSVAGASSRADLIAMPIGHLARGNGQLSVGGAARLSSFTMANSAAPDGDLIFSDASALLAGRGVGRSTDAPETSFSTRELGVFAEYVAGLAPGLDVSLGLRYDFESFSDDEVAGNATWLAASGLPNDTVPDSFDNLGAHASLTWRPATESGPVVHLELSTRAGDVDPRAIYELASRDVGATSLRFDGTGIAWPGGEAATSTPPLPALTLFGPDVRPPRAANVDLGLVQPVGQASSLFVRTSYRRTDFILRRRNLNRPAEAEAVDEFGRRVYSPLQQDGYLVGPAGQGARRFPAFAEVWALDPDGWSEYRGVTGGVEHEGNRLALFVSYTWSETRDNWIGAAGGPPDASLPPDLPRSPGEEEWGEGTSDFDVPHRVAGGATLRAGRATLSTVYRFRSGQPFTPRYRYGVDANGDGSARNDVAFVPDDPAASALVDDWPCLEDRIGAFAVRNSCRGPGEHTLSVRLRLSLGQVAGRFAELLIDGLDLIESSAGVLDEALLLVDPEAVLSVSPDGSTVTVPVTVNPDFGQTLYPTTRGRMVRLGLRIR